MAEQVYSAEKWYTARKYDHGDVSEAILYLSYQDYHLRKENI